MFWFGCVVVCAWCAGVGFRVWGVNSDVLSVGYQIGLVCGVLDSGWGFVGWAWT